MKPTLIDFNGKFARDYMRWCTKHPDMAKDEEKLDRLLPEMYHKWMHAPKKWLEGLSPEQYFDSITDPQMLVSMWIAYLTEEIDLPDLLLNRLVEEQDRVYPMLRHILDTEHEKEITDEQLRAVKAQAVALITEMQGEHPFGQYIDMLREEKEDSALAEEISAAIEDADETVRQTLKQKMLEASYVAQEYGKICLLDLLSGLGPDEHVYEMLKDEFEKPEADRVFLAGCFGKLGMEKAVSLLSRAMEEPDLDYYTYTAIRYALEELTGEEIEEKDFTGDAVYDRMAEQESDE